MSISTKPLLVNISECPRCRMPHKFTVSEPPTDGRPIYLACPKVTRHYRVTRFWVDLMPNVDVQSRSNDITKYIKLTHGEAQLQEKVSRWREIRRANIWLLDDYNDYIEHVLRAYTHGLFFPAMTSACCLAERVMNRLIIKLCAYFKDSQHYKRVYDQNKKMQNWVQLIRILQDWGVFDDEQVRIAKALHRFRTDSVHYVPGYNFEENSTEAITLLVELLDSLFSSLHRTDIFRVFEIPGEIWVRADYENDPFVKEFVLPCCIRIAAIYQLLDVGYSEDGALIGEMTEDEFIALCKEYQKDPERFHDGRTPKLIEQEIEGVVQKFVIP